MAIPQNNIQLLKLPDPIQDNQKIYKNINNEENKLCIQPHFHLVYISFIDGERRRGYDIHQKQNRTMTGIWKMIIIFSCLVGHCEYEVKPSINSSVIQSFFTDHVLHETAVRMEK